MTDRLGADRNLPRTAAQALRSGSRMRAISSSIALAAGLLVASTASASPAVDGTRNLSLGNVSRGSSYGTNAVLANPSNMSFSGTFAIEPLYQLQLKSRTSGVGIIVMDSLNNARVSLGLGYLFMRGRPQLRYTDPSTSEDRDFELSRFGHEALVAISVSIIKQWLAVGVKPKYQYASLRYRDNSGAARNAAEKLSAFGLDASLTANLAGFAALAVVGTNLTGNNDPAFTDERDVTLEETDVDTTNMRYTSLSELSEYPLGMAWGVSIFPLRKTDFSINADGYYDFSSFRFEKATRQVYGGSAEFVAGPVPLRFGTTWDSRGKGKEDDRVFISGGVAYVRPAPMGGVGVDVGFGFSQQVTGPLRDTVIGFNLGLRIHPDL